VVTAEPPPNGDAWPTALYRLLKELHIQQASWVPDAGHARLIELIEADNDVESVALTSEQEGIALAAGAWLGGQRSVLLMQSSGVGNCINMLSLMASCRFPLLTIVTMRGEWAEFNPWQIPMSRATAPTLEAMGVKVMRVETPADVIETVAAAAVLAFEAEERVAVLLSQRLLGAKKW
jgi:sulfopyruvate decarboxylase alpha subunit